MSLEIPEDPAVAEEYYNEEFESCSESSEEEEDAEASQTVSKPNHQVYVTFGKTVYTECSFSMGKLSSFQDFVLLTLLKLACVRYVCLYQYHELYVYAYAILRRH